MSDFHLPPAAHIGAVHLRVADLNRSITFYRDLLGLYLIDEDGQEAAFSSDAAFPAILTLSALPGAPHKPPRTTGLYHVAIRVPDRPALAHALRHLVDSGWPLQGAADHLVSEALYLADPDGNGLEIYADRPRDQWTWHGDQIAMATDPLDARDLLALAHGPWTGLAAGTDVGHIHLQVSDLARSEAFYADLLGFEVMQRDYPGALFVAAGGYHHHVGLNTWAGRGAPPPPPDAAGLITFTVDVPDRPAWEALAARVRAAGVVTQDGADGDGVLLRDPDGMGVRLRLGDE